MGAISRDEAVQLCEAIRVDNRGKWYSLARLQCWGCLKFSKSDPEKMCLRSQEGYDGCNLIKKCYAKQSGG